YDIESVFHAFIRSYFLSYSLPVLFYFFLLGELERTNIYSIAYENPDSWFVSNHYGCASILVFVTVIDMLQNIEINRFTRIFLVLTRSEEHTSELQSRDNLVCRLLLEKKNSMTYC